MNINADEINKPEKEMCGSALLRSPVYNMKDAKLSFAGSDAPLTLLPVIYFFFFCRISPSEWVEPEKDEHSFTLLHSFWYITGALTLQGTIIIVIISVTHRSRNTEAQLLEGIKTVLAAVMADSFHLQHLKTPLSVGKCLRVQMEKNFTCFLTLSYKICVMSTFMTKKEKKN